MSAPENGDLATTVRHWRIGVVIGFQCDDNYVLNGASSIRCLQNGKWSRPVPTCEPQEPSELYCFDCV